MSRERLQFKDVELAFNFKKIPACDQEYLRTMFYQTINDRSVKNTGQTFTEYYPDAGAFTLFDNKKSMHRNMSEYVDVTANTASHLLHGNKYYLAWTYDYDMTNRTVVI